MRSRTAILKHVLGPPTTESSEWRPSFPRGAVLRFDEVRSCHMLLLPERVVQLNATGHAILTLCDGTNLVADIEVKLASTYGALPAGEVAGFLEDIRGVGGLK